MIGILMQVRTKPEKSDEFARLTAQLQKDVRAHEPGVLVYQVMRSEEDPALFVMTEVFADEAAYKAHPDMPYHQAMSAAGWACVDGQPVIQRFTPLGDADIAGAA
ncbi:putative quinol monooxygenase [Polymorphobacter sp.]|uniref:putative quinol monooxygenase n=1 Tax=Polymorphobacter sp. TaxID=1909290 RepID=UPI003F7123B4